MSSIRKFTEKPKQIVKKITRSRLLLAHEGLHLTGASSIKGSIRGSIKGSSIRHLYRGRKQLEERPPPVDTDDYLLYSRHLRRTLRSRRHDNLSPASSLKSASPKPQRRKSLRVNQKGSQKRNGRVASSSKKAVAKRGPRKATVPNYPIPKGIKYRPDRIQTLTADHEIATKQVWCTLLKYWGYSVDIDPIDIKHRQLYIALTATGGNPHPDLLRMLTHNLSVYSKPHKNYQNTLVPKDLRRILDIQAKCDTEVYHPCVEPPDDIINVYTNWYKLNYENAPDYDGPADANDVDLESDNESFITADSELLLDEPVDIDSLIDRDASPTINTRIKQVKKTPIEQYPDINAALSQISPRESHEVFCTSLREELPDNLLLKWVRARKFDPEDTLNMLGRTFAWRNKTPANQWVMEGDAKLYITHTNPGFIKNLTVEKSWIKGTDHNHNPVFWFQAKKHFGLDAPGEEMTRYVVVMMEWVRLFSRDVTASLDTILIVFDLTGFSLKNADYTTIKFLAECLEAHYPELLGILVIYNAPWIFSTVWNIIKHWIDPNVAAKIQFCKNFKEISKFIDKQWVPTSFGGSDTTGPDYPIPQKDDELPPKVKDTNYQRVRKERDVLMMRFLDATRKWIESTLPEVLSKYLQEKIGLGILLLDNYLALDPYIRAPGVYDRNGVLKLQN